MKKQGQQDIYFSKFALVSIIWFGVISVFLGPIFYPRFYDYFTSFILLAGLYKAIIFLRSIIYSKIAFDETINQLQKRERQTDDEEKTIQLPSIINQLYHCFVIPNYKEDQEMLTQTLSRIAVHSRACKKYIVFLAMEQNQQFSKEKAERLIKKFKKSFKYIGYTVHILKSDEQQGKASNASYCCENLQSKLEELNINKNNVYVTVPDADNWVPNIYIDLVEQHIIKNIQQAQKTFFIPPQIYTRDEESTSFFVRSIDNFVSLTVSSGLYVFNRFSIPVSCYTTSFNLLKNIGFWDKTPDAIGDDAHIVCRAFWKTKGNIKTQVIYAPINLAYTCTGKGYKQDFIARFVQAQRHGQTLGTVAYNLHNFFKYPNLYKKAILLSLNLFENHLIPILMTLCIISLNIQKFILCHFMLVNINQLHEQLIIASTLTVFLVILIFENIRQKSSEKLYKFRPRISCFQSVIVDMLMYPLNMLIFIGIAFTVGGIHIMKNNREFRVSQKTKKRNLQTQIQSS